MKSKEEIEYLAANLANPNVCKTTNWIEGYTQCQEDMGKELEALRAAIRKNTWYDIDGNAQVGLYGIDNNLLNKQD